jgi:hypothetical protein
MIAVVDRRSKFWGDRESAQLLAMLDPLSRIENGHNHALAMFTSCQAVTRASNDSKLYLIPLHLP